jgi:hypothetical protein
MRKSKRYSICNLIGAFTPLNSSFNKAINFAI